MSISYCFYHRADLDGKCSAAIVYHTQQDDQVVCIDFDYGEQIPWDKVQGHKVYMVDCSLPVYQLKRMNGLASEFIWIDHHKSIVDQFPDHNMIKGVREVGKAACELTWEFLHPDTPMPLAVKLLGRYDVWDHDADYRVIPFQYGMQRAAWWPQAPAWEILFEGLEPYLELIVNAGNAIFAYQRQKYVEYASEFVYPVEIPTKEYGPLKALACNLGKASSMLFESCDLAYDLFVSYAKRPEHWVCSLRSFGKSGLDCGKIAQEFGGGGHVKAAGFTVSSLPDWLGTK